MPDLLVERTSEEAEICEVPIAEFESTLRSLGYEILDLDCRPAHSPSHELCRLLVRKSHDAAHAAMLMGFDGVAGWIHGLWVSREHQKRGHGRALIMEAEKWLVSRGAGRIHLQVRYTNLSVLGFCDKVGYSFCDVVVLGKRVPCPENREKG